MTITRIPRTIDDALTEMNAVIVRCRQQRTRLGFFAVLTRLLDEMINDVQCRIDRISPWMGVLDRLRGRTDERVCSFCIGEARTLARA